MAKPPNLLAPSLLPTSLPASCNIQCDHNIEGNHIKYTDLSPEIYRFPNEASDIQCTLVYVVQCRNVAVTALVSQHTLHGQHVADGVPHRHVDHVQQGAQLVPAPAPYHCHSVVAEHHGAVTIGLEVDSNVIFESLVMQMLDSGGNTADRHAQGVSDLGSGATVGIGGLHQPQLDLIGQSGQGQQVLDMTS